MKALVTALLLILAGSPAQAQYPKLIIQFTNKGQGSFQIGNPGQFLSARALERRTRQNIPVDSSDLPVSKTYIDSVAAAGNVTILSTSRWLNQVLIQSTDQKALNKIRQFPFVQTVSGVGYRTAAPQPRPKFTETTYPPATPIYQPRATNDALSYGNAYNQVHIHQGEYLHNKGFRGDGVQVAVLDGGFNSYKTNTAFDSVRLNGRILGERDFVTFDGSVNEDDLHGANCLSIMAANWPGRLVGSAPNAAYWLLRTEYSPTEYVIEEHHWAVGAEFADSAGANIISSSLGYTDFDDPVMDHSYAQFYKNSTMVSRAAAAAAKKGMIVMNSAGNEGVNYWRYISFPADADSVCAVGAINAAGAIAPFSGYGYPGKVKPNVVSVGWGTALAGTNGQPVSGNGTSYSNPNLAGLIACLWQAFPQVGNMQVLDAVYKSADRYTAPTDRYGFGIPNFKTAYRILKKQQNTATFGANWLVAAPNPFTSHIDATFVGQVDGRARLELVGPAGNVVATQLFTMEAQEVYQHTFTNLDALPGGQYTLRYSDSITTRTIPLQKFAQGSTDWLRLWPGNLFTGNLQLHITAVEGGQVLIRLMDTKGATVATQSITATQGQQQQVTLQVSWLPKGVYYLQYAGTTQQRVVRVMKL